MPASADEGGMAVLTFHSISSEPGRTSIDAATFSMQMEPQERKSLTFNGPRRSGETSARQVRPRAPAVGRTLAYSDAPAAPARASVPSILSIARKDPLTIAKWRPVRALLALLRERIGEEGVERLRERVVALRRCAGPSVYRAADDDPSLYLAQGACSIAKARRELDFTPAVELEEGLRRTRDYIRWRYMSGARGEGPPATAE